MCGGSNIRAGKGSNMVLLDLAPVTVELAVDALALAVKGLWEESAVLVKRFSLGGV